MELVDYVSLIAQFLTYASFLSGAKVCHIIYKQQSCSNFSPVPFLAGFNCACLWLRYSLIVNEWELITVNLVGLTCSVVYLGFFVIYTKHRARLFKQILTLLVFILTLYWSIERSVDPEFHSGALASLSSLISCAAPFATVGDVFRTKCVASLPLPIIASSFIVSLSWFTFGYLKEDNFIVFTNAVAMAISGTQLSLFAVYPSSTKQARYEKLSPSNKKSYDLIKLLNSRDDYENQEDNNPEDLELKVNLIDSSGDHKGVNYDDDDQIDTSQNYKETLTRIMSEIYVKRQQLSRKQSALIMLFCT